MTKINHIRTNAIEIGKPTCLAWEIAPALGSTGAQATSVSAAEPGER